MTSEPQEEGVALPEEIIEETAVEEIPADKDIIEEAEEAVLNKKIAATVGSYFRALAKMSDEEIYKIAFTEEGQNSPLLLELVNNAYTTMLEAGGDLPRIHFDSYKRAIESFNNTFVFNIDSKLEANRDVLIAKVIGKTESPDRISHKDIIDALSK